jgi:hypothetical protein
MKLPDTIAIWVGAIVLVLILGFGVLCFQSWIFMLLWNWIVGGVLGWKMLTFWQSMGGVLLLGIIGGFFETTSRIGK